MRRRGERQSPPSAGWEFAAIQVGFRLRDVNAPGYPAANGRRRIAMPIANTRELLLHELCELYDAEHRFLEGQVEMVHRATASKLQRAIEKHIQQTRQHIRSLERFFDELGHEPRRETNEVARGLVSEAQEGIEEARSSPLRDCVINAAVSKVEHFEMASYRSLISGARLMMGRSMAVDNLLKTNLRQEEETAQIAEQSAEVLLQEAMQAEQPKREGLLDKINKLKGSS